MRQIRCEFVLPNMRTREQGDQKQKGTGFNYATNSYVEVHGHLCLLCCPKPHSQGEGLHRVHECKVSEFLRPRPYGLA